MIRIIDIDSREFKNIVDYFNTMVVADKEPGSLPGTTTINLVPGVRLLFIGHEKPIELALNDQYYSLDMSKYYKIEIY